MNKTTLSFSLALIIVLALVAGAAVGIIYQQQKDAPQLKQKIATIGNLSSKVVSAIVTYGTITNIDSNRNIVLSYKGDTMTIAVQEGAKIYAYENSVKKEVQFQNIKVGDLVNIATTVSDDGQFQGSMVVIFSSAAPTAQ